MLVGWLYLITILASSDYKKNNIILEVTMKTIRGRPIDRPADFSIL